VNTVIVVLNGEYDLAHRSELRKEFAGLYDVPVLIVDLSAVTFFDSTCVSELVHLQNARLAKGLPPITVVQGASIVKRLFEVLNLGDVFQLVDSSESALSDDGEAVVIRHAVPGEQAGEPFAGAEA
jgi:anti-anti-sigma factor